MQVPEYPQLVCESPATQWPLDRLEQQKPPLQTPLPGALQLSTQIPAAHVGVPLLQPTQAPPVVPQSAFVMPGWQWFVPPTSQQPPLHAE